VPTGEKMSFTGTAKAALEVMDRKGVKGLVNLTGGSGKGLETTLDAFDRAHPGRFWSCTEPSYGAWLDPRYPQIQADAIEKAARGRRARAQDPEDPRPRPARAAHRGSAREGGRRALDPMWEACAAHRLPVFMHVSDPEAFFLPIDCTNERWDELGNHPEWSFHGKDFPSHQELMARATACSRDTRRRSSSGCTSGTTPRTSSSSRRRSSASPNFNVETGARIGELGRQPRTARPLLREAPGPHLLRHRCDPAPDGRAHAAAGLQGRALRDLLPLPRDR
jgi:hypothetical protein